MGIFATVYLPPLGWLREGDFQWHYIEWSTHSVPAPYNGYKENDSIELQIQLQ